MPDFIRGVGHYVPLCFLLLLHFRQLSGVIRCKEVLHVGGGDVWIDLLGLLVQMPLFEVVGFVGFLDVFVDLL